MTVEYDGTTYYYATDLQGDIIAILDADGNAVVEYTYDAWGNIYNISGSLSATLGRYNPLRYRGYVYDTETELYYLQSRYYNPAIGRFINADGLVSTGQGFVGNNMFAYCTNNPIMYYDTTGMWTMGISINASAIFILGVSVSIGFFWDDNGNCEWQWSYSVPGVNDTVTVGGLSAGVGLSFQVTDRDTVTDLYGPASLFGISGGPNWYVGADLISFADASDLDSEVNGFQVVGGVGVGVDAHVSETTTNKVGKSNNSMRAPISKRTISLFNQYVSNQPKHTNSKLCRCLLCKHNIPV